ncbi:MAG TPA: ABC transporter ATP-binding protein [Candidatus Pullichristensenella stercorigallinarum]|uniref:ABC transporter ATP-binding protein n=1 Tax=Candidatus Pullichristensenella stercorigallinarum TaxID=2840909 RepID=A0A9D1CWA3_9FIRM|nr:ABC transporter ATP-binding protein [Candidatus Pullichristensenella stercorigallinarum]
MKKLLVYLKDYKVESIVGPLFKLLEACFELIVPLLVAEVINTAIPAGDAAAVRRTALIMVLLGVLGLVCSITAQYFAAKAAVGFGAAVRAALFRHVNTLSHAEMDRLGSSGLITRLTADVDQAQAGVNLVLRLLLRSPFVVLGSIIMAFIISPKLTVIFLVATPLIGLVIYLVISRSLRLYKRIQEGIDHLSLLTRENLSGARVIRAFSRQREEAGRFAGTADTLVRLQTFAGRISAALNPATMVIVNLAVVLIIWFGGKSVDAGEVGQGDVVALVNYLTQILIALVALANLIVNFTRGTASAARIQEVLEVQPTVKDGAESGPAPVKGAPRVAFENVCFAYGGAAENVLSDVSLQAGAGETIGVIGGTGAGKSALVNLIPRFYDATAGRVLIDGVDVREYPLDKLRARIGVVPQQAVLFRGTIRENMRWGRADATDEEIWRALAIAQAKDFVEEREGGLDAMIEQGGRNLSGGQRQRLTIARALVRGPQILILDDSASALDFATDARLRAAIRRETGGMTVFIVSQRASTIRRADKIVVLDDGRVAGVGRHDELFETCPVYREICLSQLSESEVKGA